MRRARFAAVMLSAAPPKPPGPRMRTSATTSVPRSSAIRSISPSRQRQLRSTSFKPAARSRSAQRSSARAPSRFMAGLTNGATRRLTGTLYVVATPIGNLADASPRSIETLRAADLIACEDTRTTRTLLTRYGISGRTVARHEHNERTAAKSLLEARGKGKNVAVVSDAGTPALADPGAWLVAEAHRAGIAVSPLPGPSAAAAAISAAGFAASRFLFAGFLPAQSAARRKTLEALDLPWPVVLYEAPHRIRETLDDLLARFGPEREVVVARELSKKFEEVARMPLAAAAPHGAGLALSRSHPGRTCRRRGFRAADDALSHRRHAARGDLARQALGPHPGREALPGRRHHALRRRRHAPVALLSHAREDGGSRAAAAGARRIDRPCDRRLRPREGVHRADPRADARALPAAESRARAHHHARRRAVRRSHRRERRRDDHRAPPAHEPQRALHGRHPAASLLPAGAQARRAPRGAGRGGHLGQSQVLPRHRQRAACAHREGSRLRLRRHLHRARRDRALRHRLRGGRRARPARGLPLRARRALLRPAPQPQQHYAGARDLDPARNARLPRPAACAAARRRNHSLEARLSHPIYAPLAPWLGLRRPRAALHGAAAGTRTESGQQIRFVAPAGARGPYELRVHQTGCIETRDDNRHDWFNALCWLAFPRTQARINAMHAAAIPAEQGRRGPQRALPTIFDEGGALVVGAHV